MEACEDNHDEAGSDEEDAEEDEKAAEIRHGTAWGLGAGEQSFGLAEKLGGLAGFGEDTYGPG
jgi:hypothetical protein